MEMMREQLIRNLQDGDDGDGDDALIMEMDGDGNNLKNFQNLSKRGCKDLDQKGAYCNKIFLPF